MSYKRFGDIPEFNLPEFNPPLVESNVIVTEIMEFKKPKENISLKPVIDRIKKKVLSIKGCYRR